MNLYLDDNFADKTLAVLLRKAGHSTQRPADVVLISASDALQLEHAIRGGLVVLTKDTNDFTDLHQLVQTSGGSHPGILVLHDSNDAKRDMKSKDVVTAIGKLERSGMAVVNQVIVLNFWR
jgi:predicted nuclease of predicted toxin-antitoxin system